MTLGLLLCQETCMTDSETVYFLQQMIWEQNATGISIKRRVKRESINKTWFECIIVVLCACFLLDFTMCVLILPTLRDVPRSGIVLCENMLYH